MAGTSVTPFYTASAMGRFRHLLYQDESKKKKAGEIELGLGLVWNYASDATLSTTFSNGLLTTNTAALSASPALSLTGNLGVTMSTSPWSYNASASPFGKHFMVGRKLLNSQGG